MFADDVSLLFKSPTSNDAYKNITETYVTIVNWLKDHNLVINNKKSKIIQFRPHQKRAIDISYIAKQLNIEEVSDCSLLGITIDTHLDWKRHIAGLKNKLASFVYALSVLKSNTNESCALTAYYGYAHSLLRYGVLLWGHSTDAHDAFVMQKKCIRIIVNIKQTTSCKPHFIRLGVLTLPSICILESATFVRKNIHLFNFNTNPRRNLDLILPEPKIDIFKKGPYYTSIQIYNHVPSFIKSEENNNIFERKLKQHLLKKAYYTITEFMEEKKL